MRIVILGPSHKSFVSKYLLNYKYENLPEGYDGAPFIGVIIEELLAKGYEVIAITTTIHESGSYTNEKFVNGKFTWIVVPARKHALNFNGYKLGKILDLFLYERKMLKSVIKIENPDFIHAHWSYEFAGAAISSKIPYLVTVHDNAFKVLQFSRTIYRFGRLIMSELTLRRAKYASTVSPYMLKYVKYRCKNVRIIPNPVQISYLKKDLEEKILAKSLNLDCSKLITIINGWDERKNGTAVLKAFQRVKKHFPNVTLHLFGNGTGKGGEAHLEAARMNLDGVYFNGPISHYQLLKHIQSATILVHPALEESFGVVLIEAMANGLPIVAGLNSGAVPWVVNNEKLLVDLSNNEAISNKIIELLSNSGFYKDSAIKGYQNALERFSSKAVISEYDDYYNYIINEQ